LHSLYGAALYGASLYVAVHGVALYGVALYAVALYAVYQTFLNNNETCIKAASMNSDIDTSKKLVHVYTTMNEATLHHIN
jgi:hypothetical protein